MVCENKAVLWIGAVSDAIDEEQLRAHGITTLVCVARGLLKVSPCPLNAHRGSHRYALLSLVDSPEETLFTPILEELFRFLDEALRTGGEILVFCVKGQSRSVAVVAAYLMRRFGMSRSEALGVIYSARKQAQVSLSFFAQLGRESYS